MLFAKNENSFLLSIYVVVDLTFANTVCVCVNYFHFTIYFSITVHVFPLWCLVNWIRNTFNQKSITLPKYGISGQWIPNTFCVGVR